MEMHQVRYFIALCEHGSFSRAAQMSNVSQPALTTAIKRLEEEVGAPLFHRDARRLALTELGRTMKPHIEEVLGRTEAMKNIARDFQLLRASPVRVGMLGTIGPMRLAKFMEQFGRSCPQIEVAIYEATAADLLRRLDSGDLDVALMSAPDGFPESFRGETIYVERYVVVFAPGHRFEQMNGIGVADTADEAYVDRLACEMREMVLAVYADRKINLYARFRSEREDWIQSMVLANLGFAFMPEYSVTLPGLLVRPLVDPEVAREVSVVEVRGRQRTPGTHVFVQGIRSFRWPG